MATSTLNFASLNINSLNNSLNSLARFFQENNLDMIFLQETHRIDEKKVELWEKKYNLSLIPNAPNTDTDHHFKSGTAVVLHSDIRQNLSPTSKIIMPHRLQTLNLNINDQNYLFINIYLQSGKAGQNKQKREEMLNVLDKHLKHQKFDYLFLVGDFNLTLEPIDTTGEITKSSDFHCLKSILKRYELYDSYRILHPLKKTYSYIRSNAQSRIDRIYMSKILESNLQEARYLPLTFSDHIFSPVISLQTGVPDKRNFSSIWKLNDTLFSTQSQKQGFTHFFNNLLEKEARHLNPLSWWEKSKTKIKFFFQNIGKIKSKLYKQHKRLIQQKLAFAKPDEIPNLLSDLKKLEAYTENGAFIRSRSILPDDGELPTKHFFQTEKSNQQKTWINSLNIQGKITTCTNEIKQHITTHFTARWNQAPTLQTTNLKNYLSDIPTISADEKNRFSPLITVQEIKSAISCLHPNTSPGSDGLTTSFYQTFQSFLAPTLQELYNNIYLRNESPPSHKTAIIKLIPKSGTLKEIDNWRPIALLNVDYKILARIIAQRLIPLLEAYISNTQQAAIKGRHLHNILLNIKSALDYSADKKHPLALLQIDFSKAFDRLSHNFIFMVMQHIGIPSQLIKWTYILLQDINARILVNKELTQPIPLKTGIRQGCPLSMLLFALATDVLSKKISASPYLNGLTLGSASMKLQQYADDTTIILTENKEVGPALKLITEFSAHSNLQINPKKTVILSNSEILTEELRRHLSDASFTTETKILGIIFSVNGSSDKKNWSKTVAKIKHITDRHKNRNLTMFGKLAIIKTIILPHITFTGRIFPCPAATQKQISSTIHKFLWHPNSLEPIARSTLCKHKQHGGIGMPNILAWTATAFLIKFKAILQSTKNCNPFWIKFGLYNLGYKIRNLFPQVYTPNQLQRHTPNKDWSHLLNLLNKHQIPHDQWQDITHKSLYIALLQSTPAPLPKLNARLQPTAWGKVLLLQPPYKNLSNKEKEVTYKVAHSGFFFGYFNMQHNITRLPNGEVRKNNCKFCDSTADSTSHVFYECNVTRQIFFCVEKYIQKHFSTQIKFTKSLVLYNILEAPPLLKQKVLKLTAIFRAAVLDEKTQLDTINQISSNKSGIITSVYNKIVTRAHQILWETEE